MLIIEDYTNLTVCTIDKFSKVLAERICSGEDEFEYAYAVIDADKKTFGDMIQGATDWYGMKTIDCGFGSDSLFVISDMYGGDGHRFKAIEIRNDSLVKDISFSICSVLLTQLNESRNTFLLIEKVVKKDA